MLPILSWSVAGVVAAGLGALVVPSSPRSRVHLTGLASALAAGLMLGVAYGVAERGLELSTLVSALGAGAGLFAIHLVAHRRSCATSAMVRSSDVDGARQHHSLVTHALHSGSEGVALGAAFAHAPELGAVTATALILHNLPEGGLLRFELSTKVARGRTALLAMVARTPQLLVALLVWAVAIRSSMVLAATLGFGFAALVYLALAELLPLSYSHRGRTSIALIVSVAAGVVALLSALQGAAAR
jgi:zinc transporter, ZIP family